MTKLVNNNRKISNMKELIKSTIGSVSGYFISSVFSGKLISRKLNKFFHSISDKLITLKSITHNGQDSFIKSSLSLQLHSTNLKTPHIDD